MDKRHLNIKLDIAGKPYEMTINARDEEVYRLAAREINKRMATAQQTRVDGFGIQDYLAIIAVDLMISNIRMERKSDIDSGDLKALSELSERLSKHLEK
jgi:cell division protein ZapA